MNANDALRTPAELAALSRSADRAAPKGTITYLVRVGVEFVARSDARRMLSTLDQASHSYSAKDARNLLALMRACVGPKVVAALEAAEIVAFDNRACTLTLV